MRRSRFTDGEILHLIREAESGVPIPDICLAARVSIRTFYRWRRRLGGLTSDAAQHLKDLEAENRRLHRLVARLSRGEHTHAPPPLSTPRFRSEFGGEGGRFQRRPKEAVLVEDAASGFGPSVTLGRFASLRTSR